MTAADPLTLADLSYGLPVYWRHVSCSGRGYVELTPATVIRTGRQRVLIAVFVGGMVPVVRRWVRPENLRRREQT